MISRHFTLKQLYTLKMGTNEQISKMQLVNGDRHRARSWTPFPCLAWKAWLPRAKKDWPRNVIFGWLCIDWHDWRPGRYWLLPQENSNHLPALNYNMILRPRRANFITRQFDPGNACFTYQQINSIALTEIGQEVAAISSVANKSGWKGLLAVKHLSLLGLSESEKGLKGVD